MLDSLALSDVLWDRRIAMVSTLELVRKSELDIPIRLAKLLVYDSQDLMHKAVGWILREVFKKDKEITTKFLHEYASTMPRTSLRYALEKYPENQRQMFLGMKKNLQSQQN